MGPACLRVPETLPFGDALRVRKLWHMLHNVLFTLNKFYAFCLPSIDEILIRLA